MPDDQDQLPGLGAAKPRNGRRTLRDLVDSHPEDRTSPMETLLATEGGAGSAALRLGFPSADQLSRFVAGQHARLFSHLDLPSPLRHSAGGHLERRRFFAAGRVTSPDLVFTGPAAELVLVFTVSPLTETTRLPDRHSMELVRSLGHDAHGVLVSPEPDPQTAETVKEYLASLEVPMDWVRYRIELTILE